METVTKAIKKLMIKEPFYGIFASGLSRSWSTQVDHMGIVLDGLNYKLLINKKYWYSIYRGDIFLKSGTFVNSNDTVINL